MNGHNDNDICRICIKSMKMIPQDVRSNPGGGEASRPHVISLTCHGVLTDYNNTDTVVERRGWRWRRWRDKDECNKGFDGT